MLEKVILISQSSDFGKSLSHRGLKEYNISHSLLQKFNAGDTLNFSPAWNILKKLNWNLSDFRFLSSEELDISFSAYDFTFQTRLRIHDLKLEKATLNISEKENQNNNLPWYIVNVAFVPSEQTGSVLPDRLFLLHRLFEKLRELKINSGVNIKDPLMLRELQEGLNEGVYREINAVYGNFLSFIEQLLSRKFTFNTTTKNVITLLSVISRKNA